MLQKVGHAEFGRVPSAVRVPPAAVWQPQFRTMNERESTASYTTVRTCEWQRAA